MRSSRNSPSSGIASSSRRTPGDTLCVYGDTISRDFPTTPGALRTFLGGNQDGFVARINPANGTLAYSSYLGGTGVEWGHGLAVDSSGIVWVTGTTSSTDLPVTANGAQRTKSVDIDAFAVGLNLTAGTVAYGTYLGGNDQEQGFAIAPGPDGSVWVTGITRS